MDTLQSPRSELVEIGPSIALGYEHIVALDSALPAALEFYLFDAKTKRRLGFHEVLRRSDVRANSNTLSLWVLDKAVSVFRACQQKHSSLRTFSIPVLLQDLHRAAFCLQLLVAYKAHGLARGQLGLDVSERDPCTDMIMTRQNIEAMAKTGIAINLCNYGSGMTGMFYLLNLGIDGVKIAPELAGKASEESTRHLLEMIISSCKGMGLKAVVKGVNDKETRAYMQDIACELASGRALEATRFDFDTKERSVNVTSTEALPILKVG